MRSTDRRISSESTDGRNPRRSRVPAAIHLTYLESDRRGRSDGPGLWAERPADHIHPRRSGQDHRSPTGTADRRHAAARPALDCGDRLLGNYHRALKGLPDSLGRVSGPRCREEGAEANGPKRKEAPESVDCNSSDPERGCSRRPARTAGGDHAAPVPPADHSSIWRERARGCAPPSEDGTGEPPSRRRGRASEPVYER